MLGNAVFRLLGRDGNLDVWGSLRHRSGLRYFHELHHPRLLPGIDALDHDALVSAFRQAKPDVVINCVGIIKQLSVAHDPLVVLPTNAILPHRIAGLCAIAGARLVHISTDCVFSGRVGGRREADAADALDLYGQSKYIGEVRDDPHAISLRTSIIGHELGSRNALVEWFLSQEGHVPGYVKAVFSGLPAVELARVIQEFVIPSPQLQGLYHVAAQPITKCDLLRLIAEVYGKATVVVPDDSVDIDRSLNSERFTKATGYIAPEWPLLIKKMHASRNT